MNDTQRLDWLAKQIVEVRDVLPYGSREMFLAVPPSAGDWEAGVDEHSDLRELIDQRMAL